MNNTENNWYTIMNNGQKHSLHKSHNSEQSAYLFSLFDDNYENADELIVDYANKQSDVMVHCYIGNVFETTADAFMLSVIFNKQNVIEKLLKINQHKLDKPYGLGLGLNVTPRDLLNNNN
jgi:hypothetical protein